MERSEWSQLALSESDDTAVELACEGPANTVMRALEVREDGSEFRVRRAALKR